jgi:cystathionine gamma-lyase
MAKPNTSSGLTTQSIHSLTEHHKEQRSVAVPIDLTTNYKFDSLTNHPPFEYSRTNNPNREQLEHTESVLDGAFASVAFSSGLAAIDSVLQIMRKKGKLISTSSIYGGTLRLFNLYLADFPDFILLTDLTNLDAVESLMQKHPGGSILFESISNPLLKVLDIDGLILLSGQYDYTVIIDNTFLTPVLFKPILHGADIVIHSSTKYLGGHSDLVGGIVSLKKDHLVKDFRFIQNAKGAVPSTFDCWLLYRSLATLELRMNRHAENADLIAAMLNGHHLVERVMHPSVKDGNEITNADRLFGGKCGVVSVQFKKGIVIENIIRKLSCFQLAESLGGVESLINFPWKMTHGHLPESDRLLVGVTPELLRLSIGIENSSDLLDDLKFTLENYNE